MLHLLHCRRTFIAVLSLACLTLICMVKGVDVAGAIATISVALGASNAAEASAKHLANRTTDAPPT